MRGIWSLLGVGLLGYLIYCAAVVAFWIWFIAAVIAILKFLVIAALIVSGIWLGVWLLGQGLFHLFVLSHDYYKSPAGAPVRRFVSVHRKWLAVGATCFLCSGVYLLWPASKPVELPPPVTAENILLRDNGSVNRALLNARLWWDTPAVREFNNGPFIMIGGHVFRPKAGKWVEQ